MLALDDPRWHSLSHAYGRASDIPVLIADADADRRTGDDVGSTWFSLWSALCHQGDAYTASYAAVPHLMALAPNHLQRKQYEPLYLAACIELARLEGRAPPVPEDLAFAYQAAVA